jgi:hypothetical protein
MMSLAGRRLWTRRGTVTIALRDGIGDPRQAGAHSENDAPNGGLSA